MVITPSHTCSFTEWNCVPICFAHFIRKTLKYFFLLFSLFCKKVKKVKKSKKKYFQVFLMCFDADYSECFCLPADDYLICPCENWELLSGEPCRHHHTKQHIIFNCVLTLPMCNTHLRCYGAASTQGQCSLVND